MINYEKFFSSNAKGMKKSEIRELLKLTNKPGIISFAGGLPAPDLFPVEGIKEVAEYVLGKEGRKALQYGETEGVYSLREQLLKFLNEDGIDIPIEQLIVTTSSQQGLDLIAKIFVDPGDIIMTGNPTYLGAIQAFNAYGAKMKGIELDNNGMNIEMLDREIKKFIDIGKKPKFIYVIPDFQNPSGITMNLERRKKLIEVAEKYDLIILEDSPYRQLRFEGEAEPPLISLNSERVISIYTFSKILLPGFRLGWMVGPKELIQKVIIAKQSTDLCSPPFNQYVLAEFIKRGLLKKQISKIISAYREKKDFMLDKLQKYMPELEGLTWTAPEGGLFLWVTLPKYMDIAEMFEKAVKRNIAYVVGTAFYPNEGGKNSCRLNFSYASMEQIDEGIKKFGDLVKEWNKK